MILQVLTRLQLMGNFPCQFIVQGLPGLTPKGVWGRGNCERRVIEQDLPGCNSKRCDCERQVMVQGLSDCSFRLDNCGDQVIIQGPYSQQREAGMIVMAR